MTPAALLIGAALLVEGGFGLLNKVANDQDEKSPGWP